LSAFAHRPHLLTADLACGRKPRDPNLSLLFLKKTRDFDRRDVVLIQFWQKWVGGLVMMGKTLQEAPVGAVL